MKTKIIVAVVLGIVLVSGVVAAAAEVLLQNPGPGITLSAIAIDDSAGGADNTAVYTISAFLDPGVGVSEHVNLSINQSSSPSWIYTFSENEFDIDPGDTKGVMLTMVIPDGVTAGNYNVTVNSNATVPTKPWLPPETTFARCFVNVSSTIVAPTPTPTPTPSPSPTPTPTPTPPPVPVPEYNIFGLLALVGILSVVLATIVLMRKE